MTRCRRRSPPGVSGGARSHQDGGGLEATAPRPGFRYNTGPKHPRRQPSRTPHSGGRPPFLLPPSLNTLSLDPPGPEIPSRTVGDQKPATLQQPDVTVSRRLGRLKTKLRIYEPPGFGLCSAPRSRKQSLLTCFMSLQSRLHLQV
ncbi:hypothetical protein VULLAG_LOCUS9944 [Vulpes lagopus]